MGLILIEDALFSLKKMVNKFPQQNGANQSVAAPPTAQPTTQLISISVSMDLALNSTGPNIGHYSRLRNIFRNPSTNME